MNTPAITSASVRVMRSHDYSHFEVCLTSSEATTIEQANELRKAAARLADKAVAQFITMKEAMAAKDNIKQDWLIKRAEETLPELRTPEQKAVIKYHSDKAFANRFVYDYEDDYEEPWAGEDEDEGGFEP